MSDPVSGTYRSREEVDDRTDNSDPIKILRDRLYEAELLTSDELEILDAEVRGVVAAAAQSAEDAPEPRLDGVYEHVYSEINVHGRLFFDGRER
jgi:pyruvate dehydrogenase E1 component alpha subunit